jgi:hypothetical protein
MEYLHMWEMHHSIGISPLEMHEILDRFYSFLNVRRQLCDPMERDDQYLVISSYVQALDWKDSADKEDTP